ncbi:MAG: hypothetical protein V4613_05520 [Bacteroidota bacterium]
MFLTSEMKLYLLVLFTLHLASNAHSQTHDSTVRKYMVIQPHSFAKASLIIKEGKTIIVKDNRGIKNRGHLHILSDSSFFLYNSFRNESDTYLLKNVATIKYPTVGNVVVSVGLTASSVAFYALAGWAFQDGEFTGVGIILVGIGVLSDVIAITTVNGLKYSGKKSDYSIVKTKGYKLRRYHLNR